MFHLPANNQASPFAEILPWAVHRRVVFTLALALASAAHAQTSSPIAAASLPDGPAFTPAQSAVAAAQPASAAISGTVVDFNHGVIPRAKVILTFHGAILKTAETDPSGQFSFASLPPGTYRISATAPGMGTYVSAELYLTSGKALQLTDVALAVGATTADVQVVATPEQIAEEQVHEEEHQRAFGILPNFYSSYIWDAAPMNTRQKFHLGFRAITDPFAFVGAGIVAGAEQINNSFPAYGPGIGGYGKRYGAAYADGVSSRMIGGAILPSLFHQDPRYFYKGSGTRKSRALYAIRCVFVTRGDSGHLQPNYSYLIGAFAAGGVAYTYHPAADRGGGLILRNGSIQIGAHAVDELIREFVLRGITNNLPDYKNGKPAARPTP